MSLNYTQLKTLQLLYLMSKYSKTPIKEPKKLVNELSCFIKDIQLDVEKMIKLVNKE